MRAKARAVTEGRVSRSQVRSVSSRTVYESDTASGCTHQSAPNQHGQFVEHVTCRVWGAQCRERKAWERRGKRSKMMSKLPYTIASRLGAGLQKVGQATRGLVGLVEVVTARARKHPESGWNTSEERQKSGMEIKIAETVVRTYRSRSHAWARGPREKLRERRARRESQREKDGNVRDQILEDAGDLRPTFFGCFFGGGRDCLGVPLDPVARVYLDGIIWPLSIRQGLQCLYLQVSEHHLSCTCDIYYMRPKLKTPQSGDGRARPGFENERGTYSRVNFYPAAPPKQPPKQYTLSSWSRPLGNFLALPRQLVCNQ